MPLSTAIAVETRLCPIGYSTRLKVVEVRIEVEVAVLVVKDEVEPVEEVVPVPVVVVVSEMTFPQPDQKM